MINRHYVVSCLFILVPYVAHSQLLPPSGTFSLAQKLNHPEWKQFQVKEMRATPTATWFLIEAVSRPPKVAIVRTDTAGNVLQFMPLENKRAIGLAATRDGVATVLLDQSRTAVLTEYDQKSNVLAQTPVKCFGAEFLIAIDGYPSTICADGTIEQHSRNGSAARFASWARPGSLVEALQNGHVVVIDRATAQMLQNNLANNQIAIVTGRGQDIEEAVKNTSIARQQASAALRADTPPLGRPVIIMDTASDAGGWYALVWPYHPRSGPAVTKFNNTGQLASRIRCRGPFADNSSLHQIEVQNGYLLLCSVTGTVYRYKL